eukprot:NODE_3792_length_522_cov_104.090909_g3227_i0.p3 GENE.NODE_3792_length_522_cov_104.090909_g3227_i0~~NODE_3792_length_522_cov_104.090909_g3227_i0.p3  ORF type:complete len:88 (-),score=16.73 NODE_3792_length_522_cov_104.090909_g3227_i0:44-307(-)
MLPSRATTAERRALGLMFWMFCRAIKQMRGIIPRSLDWDVHVDLFFHRDEEQVAKQMDKADTEDADAKPARAATFTAKNPDSWGAGY